MSGLKSLRKGKAGEYAARDHLRSFGFEVDRVPASGASKGFKGDLRIRKDGKEWLGEVKVRASAFGWVYKALEGQSNGVFIVPHIMSEVLYFSLNPTDLIPYVSTDLDQTRSFSVERLRRMQDLLGPADLLVVKSDRKPFVYMRFLGGIP